MEHGTAGKPVPPQRQAGSGEDAAGGAAAAHTAQTTQEGPIGRACGCSTHTPEMTKWWVEDRALASGKAGRGSLCGNWAQRRARVGGTEGESECSRGFCSREKDIQKPRVPLRWGHTLASVRRAVGPRCVRTRRHTCDRPEAPPPESRRAPRPSLSASCCRGVLTVGWGTSRNVFCGFL